MFKEYYNDSVKTSAAFTEGRLYKTDDIGIITKEEELFVEGRKSNVIIFGHLAVMPEILEGLIKIYLVLRMQK